jgi:chromosome segregation ATPase
VKQAAYSGAQTLTGTARVDAMKSANVAFRTGFKAALKTLNTVKRDKRSNHQEIRECKKDHREDKKDHREDKKEEKKDDREDKKEHREEVKSQVKSLKDRIKELKEKRDEARGQSTGRR